MLIVLASLGLIRRHRPIDAESSANTSTGTVQFQEYWASIGAHTGIGTADCRDGVHFQYGHLPSARTSIGVAAMAAFISSMGTCQVPVPVLARSITNNGKYSLPILVNSIILWKNCG
jgi:hypothetical protein